jgi:hypothetical protein
MRGFAPHGDLGQIVEYIKTFERKMLAADYQIRGTITVFVGLRFSDDNPYSYR